MSVPIFKSGNSPKERKKKLAPVKDRSAGSAAGVDEYPPRHLIYIVPEHMKSKGKF